MSRVTVFKNVYDREHKKKADFSVFLRYPGNLYNLFHSSDYRKVVEKINNETRKDVRNTLKRNILPAVDLSKSGFLSIDIDGLNTFEGDHKKQEVIDKLKEREDVYCIADSISGNLVIFFKYDCDPDEFQFLYYRLYLELTLLLHVPIDFLPELNRLRYISNGKIHYINESSHTVIELMHTDSIPYISTSMKKDEARKRVFGSR